MFAFYVPVVSLCASHLVHFCTLIVMLHLHIGIPSAFPLHVSCGLLLLLPTHA